MDSNSQSAATETIPGELMGRVPRNVRLSSNCRVQFTIGTMLLAVGASIAILSIVRNVHQKQHMAELRLGGNETDASITSLGPEGRSNIETVRYDFNANGTIFTGKSVVPNQMNSGLHASGSLPIRYLPADPTINHPAAWEWSPQWGILFGSMMYVAGGLFSFLFTHGQRRIVREGTPAVASITSCSSSTGRSIWFAVKYEFRTEDGTVTQGRGRYENALDVGTQICVLYLPLNPQRSLPYGSANYRAVE